MRSKSAAVAAVVTCLGVGAGPALATDGFSLGLSGPSGAVLGKPVVLTVVGKNPDPTAYPYATYLNVYLFAPDVVPACPDTDDSGGQLATGTGGAIIDYLVQIREDASGNFSTPAGFTPGVSGPLLVCGYTVGLAGETLAAASLTVAVQDSASSSPAPSTQAPGRPAVLTAPRLTRSGNRLTCGKGSWSNAPSHFSYRWLVGGRANSRASGQTLPVTRTLRRRKVRCGVTATNPAGSSTAMSNQLLIR